MSSWVSLYCMQRSYHDHCFLLYSSTMWSLIKTISREGCKNLQDSSQRWGQWAGVGIGRSYSSLLLYLHNKQLETSTCKLSLTRTLQYGLELMVKKRKEKDFIRYIWNKVIWAVQFCVYKLPHRSLQLPIQNEFQHIQKFCTQNDYLFIIYPNFHINCSD